jgi:hypothetical protein
MKVAFDIELMRPGCVLVAAALGADMEPCSHFDTDSWLLAPTPGMRVFETTPEQLKTLVRVVEMQRKK